MKKGNYRAHSVSGAFVFLLLGVFAVFSTLMVAMSAQMYRDTVDRTQQHHEERIAANYLMNMVHGGDSYGAITAEEREGIPVLVIAQHDVSLAEETWDDDDTTDYSSRWISSGETDEAEEENLDSGIYETLIYCWEGKLYELLKDTACGFQPGDGETICALQSLVPAVQGNMLQLELTDTDGTTTRLHVRLYTAETERASE